MESLLEIEANFDQENPYKASLFPDDPQTVKKVYPIIKEIEIAEKKNEIWEKMPKFLQ